MEVVIPYLKYFNIAVSFMWHNTLPKKLHNNVTSVEL